MRRRGLPTDGVAQGLFTDRLPGYVDFLVPEEPRSQAEAEFIGALRHGVNEGCEAIGCKVAEVTSNYGNQGYRFLVVDRERRPLYFGVTYDEMIETGAELGEYGMFGRIVALCVERCKAEMAKRNGYEATH